MTNKTVIKTDSVKKTVTDIDHILSLSVICYNFQDMNRKPQHKVVTFIKTNYEIINVNTG